MQRTINSIAGATSQGNRHLIDLPKPFILITAPPTEFCRKIFDHSCRQSPLVSDRCICVNTQCLKYRGFLKSAKHENQRLQISKIGNLKRRYVFSSEISIDDHRQKTGAQKYKGRQCASRSSVPILIGMNLGEAVMEPCRHQQRVFIPVLVEPVEKILHFRIDL